MTVGSVGNTGFLAFWVDLSVAANLVAEIITNVSGGMSGVKIAEAGLTVPSLGHIGYATGTVLVTGTSLYPSFTTFPPYTALIDRICRI
jgi:hypothetical protein